jgi:hypothetical protein
MKLIDEIILMASDGKTPIADGLRKCLILSFQLKNEKLKAWAEKELNGFDKEDVVPKYRQMNPHSKGNFSGIGGAWLTNRPLPITVLKREHWDLLSNRMAQPIAAYESLIAAGPKQNVSIPWAPDLILEYQESFIAGFALSNAWQEIPMSLVIGLCEEVRNRLLRFALELKDEMGHVGDEPSAVPTATVEAAVTNYIYGGTNVIAGTATNFSQFGNVIIAAGDFEALAKALTGLGIPGKQIDELKGAIDTDNKNFGERTKGWMEKVGKVGVKAGVAIGQDIVKDMLLQYFGLN